jgi:hypothetical protein
MCKTRLDLKIHPRPSRGCKVRVKPGSHHRPSRRCRIRGDPGTHGRRGRRVQDSGKLGGPPEGAEDGARIGGNPSTHRQPSLKVQDSGKLGDPICWRGGWSEDWGQSRDSPSSEPEGAGFEETRRPHRMVRGMERGLGATPALTVNRAGRCRIRGDSEPHSKAERLDAWFE